MIRFVRADPKCKSFTAINISSFNFISLLANLLLSRYTTEVLTNENYMLIVHNDFGVLKVERQKMSSNRLNQIFGLLHFFLRKY